MYPDAMASKMCYIWIVISPDDTLLANDNLDPLACPHAALAYLHDLRRQLMAQPVPADAPLSQWRERRELVEELRRVEAMVYDKIR